MLALALLPGWIVETISDGAAGQTGAMEIIGATAELSDGDRVVQGQAETRTLAACIAALRARAVSALRPAPDPG